MSNEAQAAFNIYFAQFDPEESEWLDRSTEQIFIDGFNAGSAENAALKEENERLKKNLDNRKEDYSFLMEKYDKSAREAIHLRDRVAELEKEDTLWAMLDTIEKALFKKAAPHAWESIVTSAGMEFITSRRKAKAPANASPALPISQMPHAIYNEKFCQKCGGFVIGVHPDDWIKSQQCSCKDPSNEG